MFKVRTRPLAPRSLAVALAGLALAAPTAALAQPFEASAPPPAPVKHANVYVPPTPSQAAVGQPKTVDLRSPDAKDAAARAVNGYTHGTTYAPVKPVEGNPALAISKLTPEQIAAAYGHAPTPPVTHVSTATVHAKASDDGFEFDWGSAGIGAGAAGGLALIALGGFGLASRTRVRVAR